MFSHRMGYVPPRRVDLSDVDCSDVDDPLSNFKVYPIQRNPSQEILVTVVVPTYTPRHKFHKKVYNTLRYTHIHFVEKFSHCFVCVC